MALTTPEDVVALVSEHPGGIGLHAAITELVWRARELHPLPDISESIMATLEDGRVELTVDRQLKLT